MSNHAVANIILSQLGGQGRIRAMTGAKAFVAAEDSVSFQFVNRSPHPNGIVISLKGDDTYDVTFTRCARYDFKVVERLEGLHAEDLKPAFERCTGLYLSLGV